MKKTRISPLDDLLDESGRRKFAEYLIDRTDATMAAMSDLFQKWKIYERQMDDDFSWRGGGKGTRDNVLEKNIDALVNDIFDYQNDSPNIIGGFAEFMTARAGDDIFGTDPFYALSPEGIEDQPLTEAMQRHSEWKLRGSDFKSAALDAIDLAFGIGMGVLKQTWDTETDVFERIANVLHVDGTPYVTATGERITEEDMDQLVMAPGSDGVVYVTAPTIDPEFAAPSQSVSWAEVAIEETNILFNGVRIATMHYGDFLFDPTAATLNESRFVGHRFQMPLSEARIAFDLTDEQAGKLASGNEDAKSEQAKPNTDRQEGKVEPAQTTLNDPILHLIEAWVKCDLVGDGRLRRIRAVVEYDTQEILEMDYMANCTPNGQLPFTIVRAYTVKNRIYGKGYYELYENAQEFIDRNFNRIEYRNRYHSNPAILIDDNFLSEGDDIDEFKLVPGKTYKKRAGSKMEDAVNILTFPDLDERTWTLLQFFIQVVQTRSGVTSAAQGEVSSLPSTATATGIESIMQSASVLARRPIGNLKLCFEQAIKFALKLIYSNFDVDEAYTYWDGDTAKVAMLQTAAVPRNIDMNVKLLLTRFKQREAVESSTQAIGFYTKYLAVPEQEKANGRPLFLQAIKGLGFDNADTIIRPPLQIDPMTGLPVGQAPLPPGSEGAPEAGPEAQPPQA